MLLSKLKYLLFVYFACFMFTCKKPFWPVPLTAKNNYLVVDGNINTAGGGVTSITLSRARNLSDSTHTILPQSEDSVVIERSGGAFYPLQQFDSVYVSDPLNLSNGQTYRLHITTADGSQYQSEYVSVKQSPAIDSLTWRQD